MDMQILNDKKQSGRAAAEYGAKCLREAIAAKGYANIIVATGASQFEMLDALVHEEGIAWNKVHAFHLDEYVGMALTHPASFRLYLWRRFVSRLPLPLASFHYLNGEQDPKGECRRVGEIIKAHPIDVAFVGVGENGHLAFNDPPADFVTEEPYLVVNLDEACRRQQLGEGWFKSLSEVPTQAISMSVQQIMKSKVIIVTVPDQRKAQAIKGAVKGEITPMCPSSILQKHNATVLYLDRDSASLL